MNNNIKFIYDIFNNLIDNEFKSNRESMVSNGEIFYFNGDNGSKFDWFNNNHTSTLTTLYQDGTESIKIHIYQDGTINAYYYKEGSISPDNTISTTIDPSLALNIAITLYSISDKVNLFDKRLSNLDLNYQISNEDITSFNNEI